MVQELNNFISMKKDRSTDLDARKELVSGGSPSKAPQTINGGDCAVASLVAVVRLPDQMPAMSKSESIMVPGSSRQRSHMVVKPGHSCMDAPQLWRTAPDSIVSATSADQHVVMPRGPLYLPESRCTPKLLPLAQRCRRSS